MKKELSKDQRYERFTSTVGIDFSTGKEIFITRDTKDYSYARNIKEQVHIFCQRISQDLEMININQGMIPNHMKMIGEP